MKKRIIQFIVLFVIISNIQAQRLDITIDSLRFRFQNEKPYDVYDYYRKGTSEFSKDNYKSLYYDTEMKNYFLKWLNQDQIIDYERDRHKKYLNGFDEESKTSFIESYISRVFKLNPDSIKADTNLWKLYADSAISSHAEKQKMRLLQKKEESKRDVLPDYLVMNCHAKIAYPEAYKIIKDWWYQYDKPTATDYGYFDDLFISLLLMNDPEAQSEFDKIVKRYVQTNGTAYKEDYGLGFIRSLRAVKNAYGLRKMIELLPVRVEVIGLSSMEGTSYDPLDYRMYGLLNYVFMSHGINTLGLFDDLDTMRKNSEEIVRLANQLIKELEEDEKYWMENMPFDYVPDIK